MIKQKVISKKRIGQVLVESEIISPDELQDALDLQKKGDTAKLGEIVVRLGYATEGEIETALAMQYDHPFINIADYKIDKSCLELIPPILAIRFGLIPVERIDKILMVAISDPSNTEAIQKLEETTKLKVRTLVATSNDIRDAIVRHYGSNEDVTYGAKRT